MSKVFIADEKLGNMLVQHMVGQLKPDTRIKTTDQLMEFVNDFRLRAQDQAQRFGEQLETVQIKRAACAERERRTKASK